MTSNFSSFSPHIHNHTFVISTLERKCDYDESFALFQKFFLGWRIFKKFFSGWEFQQNFISADKSLKKLLFNNFDHDLPFISSISAFQKMKQKSISLNCLMIPNHLFNYFHWMKVEKLFLFYVLASLWLTNNSLAATRTSC